MNKSFKSIPQILIGKTIAFTGTFPGVGKTYTKHKLVEQLTDQGYRVFNTGTTQKASVDGGQTIASLCLDSHNNWEVKGKPRTKTEAFFIIDEAFMYSQESLNKVKNAYPKCCFILFGDPMQFEPVDRLPPITDIDLIFSLDKMMRVKDQDLIDALQMIKNGRLPEEFMYKHCTDDINDSMLLLCYNKKTSSSYSDMFEDTPVKTLYKSTKRVSYIDEYEDRQYSVYDKVCNGDLWRLLEVKDDMYTLGRISGYREEITIPKEIFYLHFKKQNALNCHKIQGDTIRGDAADIIIWFDKNIEYNNQSLLRFLYVALSRPEYSRQIHFCYEQVKEVIENYRYNGPLYDYLDIAHNPKCIHTSSSELCISDILETISYRLSGCLPNLADYQSYIDGKSATFGKGKNQNNYSVTANISEISYQIYYDQRMSDKLQNKLDSRTVQSVPRKEGKCFITVNETLNSRNLKDLVTEYNWFVLEIDTLNPEEIYKRYIDPHCKNKEAKKACFRIVYSGNKSYHFWFYIDNPELQNNRKLYAATHMWLNNTFFDGLCDTSIATPEHYVRAPGIIRPDTGKEQSLVSIKGKKVIHIDNILDLMPPEHNIEPTVINCSNGNVEQAFETYKDDIPTTNGGRGKIILSKLYKEFYRGFLDKAELKELAKMLCNYAHCPEKSKHMSEYIDEM